MKKIFLAVSIFLFLASFAFAEKAVTTPAMSVQEMDQLIDKQFEGPSKLILEKERSRVESLMPKDKADKYMEYFQKGMCSYGGAIMIEGAENQWLEKAFEAGHQQRVIFMEEYFKRLVEAAGSPAQPAKQPLTPGTTSNNSVAKELKGKNISQKKAVKIAETAVKEKGIDLNPYYCQSLKDIGPAWVITYDLKEKLSQKERGVPVKLGGQIFVKVDKINGDAVITFGE
jgi:hypothetical protein